MLRKLSFVLELLTSGIYLFFYQARANNNIALRGIITDWIEVSGILVIIIIWIVTILKYLEIRNFGVFLRKNIFSVLVLIPLTISFNSLELIFWIALTHLGSSILSIYDPVMAYDTPIWGGTNSLRRGLFSRLELKPAQTVILSFFSVCFIGGIFLALPFVTVDGKMIPFIDAIFIATSAVCVTGLSTLDIPTTFNLLGQIIILLLIQLGGIGIMSLSTSMLILLGRNLGIKNQLKMQDILDTSGLDQLKELCIDIVKYTIFIEFWGGILLSIAFFLNGLHDPMTAIYYGIFHSISAFCNAGLALFSNSFESFATDPFINLIIITLITLGGFGFIVLKEFKEMIFNSKKISRILLHTKVVVITSVIVTIVSIIVIFLNEYLGSFSEYSIWEKFQMAFFQSVSARTAGFTSLKLDALRSSTIYFIIILMMIGASPASTGGGLKTTTLVILIGSVISTLLGKSEVTIFKRRISQTVVLKAMAISFIYVSLAFFFIFLLLLIEEDKSFQAIFFEVFSAIGTVGQTLGITEFLSTMGKSIIAMVMFLGRVGPLTLFIAFTKFNKSEGKVSYPEGRILIG